MEIEEILAVLGLNLPQVLMVNTAVEGIKGELEKVGVWERIKGFAWMLPFAVAIGACLLAGDGMVGAVPCGISYGLAAIALHEFHGSFVRS